MMFGFKKKKSAAPIVRKGQTGEPGNKGQFGSKVNDPDAIALAPLQSTPRWPRLPREDAARLAIALAEALIVSEEQTGNPGDKDQFGDQVNDPDAITLPPLQSTPRVPPTPTVPPGELPVIRVQFNGEDSGDDDDDGFNVYPVNGSGSVAPGTYRLNDAAGTVVEVEWNGDDGGDDWDDGMRIVGGYR